MTHDAPPISYTVSVDPLRHELSIVVLIDNPALQPNMRLEHPTWVPGDYEFMPFVRDLASVAAQDAESGTPVQISRDGWQAFKIENAPSPVRVSYTAYGYDPDFAEPCGLVDSTYAVLLGGHYLHLTNWTGPCRVTYNLPAGWAVHHPAGATQVGASTAWDYPSYEILLDTPVVMGQFDLLQRTVGTTPFYFAFVDRTLGFESQAARYVDQVAAVCANFGRMFGGFPFENYTFVLTFNPALDWGLEHLTSTMCGLGPDVFIDPSQFATAVRVCAHELFHAWNVRRLRPAPLKRLDLSNGTFTEGLWVAEGFTRYYEFLSCTRTGIYTPDQFFSSVVNYYSHLAVTPAYRRVPAVDSSLATYGNHDKYPGRCNNSIDYYDKGMVIAFTLDALLRMKQPADSLDQAFSGFYEKFVDSELGYTTSDVEGFFENRLEGLGALIRQQATAPASLSVEKQLQALGFSVQTGPVRYAGLMFMDGGGSAIYGVLDDSPAGQTGIAPNDVIVSVNGYPFSAKGLKWAVQNLDPVQLTVQRGQRSLLFAISPIPSAPQITGLTWNGTEAQVQLIRDWLQSDTFNPRPGQSFNLDFYDNFHGIETTI